VPDPAMDAGRVLVEGAMLVPKMDESSIIRFGGGGGFVLGRHRHVLLPLSLAGLDKKGQVFAA
jgi:hypothetical protein